MKTLIIYSSLTGNTKKLAEAMARELEDAELIPADQFQVSHLQNFDCFMIGYWINKGDCDELSQRVIAHMQGKKLVLFGSLGAKENSAYYDMIKQNVEKHVHDAHLLGHFLCQGNVGEKTIERYQEMLAKNPEDIHLKAQLEAYEEGIHHPNEQDIQNAITFIKTILGS